MKYKTEGVCAKEIHFEIIDDKVHNVDFVGGCKGNTQGLARLVEGMTVQDTIEKLQGIQCEFRATSCPDQLAQALKKNI